MSEKETQYEIEGYLFEPDKSNYPHLVGEDSDTSSSEEADSVVVAWQGRARPPASAWCHCGQCVRQKTDEESFSCKEHELLVDKICAKHLQCFTDLPKLAEYVAHRPSLEMMFVDSMTNKHYLINCLIDKIILSSKSLY
jgi:hypothetical protein